ncbi:hypothetical protein [Burkholderia seminalis]|uniref:hypothetical protein n=1 Tax=Burkholderia seminalis TaxID=488731 RepID=UPI00114CA4E4|nr:hypothetical protein [Burkholderia seminalis]
MYSAFVVDVFSARVPISVPGTNASRDAEIRPGRSALPPRLGRIRKLGLLRAIHRTEEADEKHPRQQQASGGRSHSRYRKSVEEI